MRAIVAVSLLLVLPVSFTLSAPPGAEAQSAEAVGAGSDVGYELALHGATMAERGSELRLAGIVYEVQGLDQLRATAGLDVAASITAARRDGRDREERGQARARSIEGGRFELAITIPAEDLGGPQLELTISRPGRPGRLFRFALAQLVSRTIDLLTDRNRYEPGETVRVWSRLRTVRGATPISGERATIALIDPRGAAIAASEARTGESGAAIAELVIPESAATGGWTVRVRADDRTPEAQRTVSVVQRTVERLAIAITLERELIEPGGAIRGRIRVATPSGSPVRGASVLVTVGDDAAPPIELTTDDEGIAVLDASAPSFLAGDVASMQVIARVAHGAYGTLASAALYTLARTRWLVSATPEAGGLVPEVDSELFLAVADPRGRPLPAGTELEVRGIGVRGAGGREGRATAVVDAHGIASVPVRLPRGAAARMQGGACAMQSSTSFEVEVRAQPVIVARVCARVAVDAQVLARVVTPVVAPGGSVEVEVSRRPAASGRAILLEALYQDRAIAFGWIVGSARSGTIALPSEASGVLQIRARVVAAQDAVSASAGEPGATAVAKGSIAAVLIRPSDAFALEVTPDRELHRVREPAEIRVHATVAPERGWIALLARDEAAHGGESDFALETMRTELRDVLRGTLDPAHDRFVRASLAAGLPIDGGVPEPAPLTTEPWQTQPWEVERMRYAPGPTSSGGVLRDPIAMREELRRRGLGPVMLAIERMVARLASDRGTARASLTRASGRRVELHPDAIVYAVQSGELHPSQARTLGGQDLTVAMITAADPSFTFDRIARRVARQRLVQLLLALARFASPDDPAAARASAGEPPERWLARIVQLAMLPADALLDPWGRPFVLRRVTGRRPAFVVSERAVDFELTSAGPDGVPGNTDDVRDPFERVVPRGTPYAVVSGEDRLLEQLSALAPGERVLASMAQAYARLGLAAEEERRRGPVTATVSEEDAAEMPMAEPSAAAPMPPPAVSVSIDRMEVDGRGGAYGGGPMEGADRGGAAEAQRGPARRFRDAPADDDADAEPAEQSEDEAGNAADERLSGMGALVREEFPATLFFVGEVTLDASGDARVTIPLADALTTYRLEAIGWSASGWTTSGRASVRVDQDAMIDAPIPLAAVIGDRIRVPVRLQNRTAEPIRARIEVALEGDAGIDLPPLDAIDVAGGQGAETILELAPRSAGVGAIVIRALREDGTALDAVRRPIRVIEDARRVRERRDELVRDGDVITIDVPARALARGPAQLRVAVAGAIVGEPTEWASEGDALWAAWALAMAARDLDDATSQAALAMLQLDERQDEHVWYGYDPLRMAVSLGATWRLRGLTEHAARAALRYLSSTISDSEEPRARDYLPQGPPSPSWLLVALAPAITAAGEQPALRDDLSALVARLRRLASAEGAEAVEKPGLWALVAAALELSRSEGEDARAQEMMRRIERHVIAVADEAWLEPDQDTGTAEPRIEPSALLALARIASGRPDEALPLIRSIANAARGARRWDPRARALASAAAARLVSGPVRDIRATLDGRPITIALAGGIASADLEGLGTGGAHRLAISLPRGALALATIELSYALPWDVAPLRDAPIELEWEGEIGARDVRSALLLHVRNRGARVSARPLVEIELPAGAELDEPTRASLTSLLAAPPELEGSTLRLRLRPMAPGGFARLPLRARWSVGGAMRGLGASAWDDASPPRADARPVRVLASREVTIADQGPEPEPPDAEASDPPRPPPPHPVPLPRPLAEVAR
jgi:hypothetical protein